jgi:uncharacterized membrane protein YkvA (DUF1232 family)
MDAGPAHPAPDGAGRRPYPLRTCLSNGASVSDRRRPVSLLAVSWPALLVVTLVVLATVWALLVAALALAGRRADAAALARFVPDCIVLLTRLLRDPRVPRRRRILLALTLAYLATPIDLVPDVIPVAGQLDDAIVVGLALRGICRAAGPGILREHWPGPERSLAPVLRLAGIAAAA